MSGALHLASDYMQGVPLHKSGSLKFVLGSALGIMVEDGAQAAYQRVSGTNLSGSRDNGTLPVWKRLVGYLWVATWLSLLSPDYLLPSNDLPKESRWYIPFIIKLWRVMTPYFRSRTNIY